MARKRKPTTWRGLGQFNLSAANVMISSSADDSWAGLDKFAETMKMNFDAVIAQEPFRPRVRIVEPKILNFKAGDLIHITFNEVNQFEDFCVATGNETPVYLVLCDFNANTSHMYMVDCRSEEYKTNIKLNDVAKRLIANALYKPDFLIIGGANGNSN